jgi:hypothetical protein
MNIASRDFAISSASGTVIYREGQIVPDAIAKMYPENIVGGVKTQEAESAKKGGAAKEAKEE